MSDEATGSSRPDGADLPGEPGVWVLIAGDLAFFTLLFATFGYYRMLDPAGFAASQAALDRTLGLLNTLLLLTSSWAVAKAIRLGGRGAAGQAGRMAGLGIALGMGFVAVKAVEYSEKLKAGLSPLSNDFFMLYFALTGVHLLHVLAGLGVLIFLRARLLRSAAAGRDRAAECCGLFWHMVDLLWVILFALFYLVR